MTELNATTWEVVRPSRTPTITIFPKGMFRLSASAIVELGDPAAILILVRDGEYAISPCQRGTPGARTVTREKTTNGLRGRWPARMVYPVGKFTLVPVGNDTWQLMKA